MPFPFLAITNPYGTPDLAGQAKDWEWQTEDWDPALRFWTLPFPSALSQWQRTVDLSLPSIQAALEVATADQATWRIPATTLTTLVPAGWLEANDLAWRPDPANAASRANANATVLAEIQQLQVLMEDDRDRYMGEIEGQADGLAGSIMAFLAIDVRRYPWTVELISAGLAIGNVVYMYAKAHFKRVRPSFLCPGLVPAFGPPEHPSFPSGHSFLGHFIALLLLEIPAVQQRYGVFAGIGGPAAAVQHADLVGSGPINSPLLWLAQRLAKNRERLGVHYPSDSVGSRHIAAGLWVALFRDTPDRLPGSLPTIDSPTLRMILERATAEWPPATSRIV